MIIKCTYCGKKISVAGDDPGAKDINDYNRGFFENFYNGTVYDDCYIEKKDKGPEIDQYIDKYKRNWTRKKNVPTLLEDDVGISTENKTESKEMFTKGSRNVGIVKNSFLYYKCPHCARVYFKNIKYSNNPDPNALDTNHINNGDQFGTRAVDNVSNSPYKSMDDFNRGNSSVKDNEPKKVKKITWKKK
jgi:phage FluMu protein Com